MKNIQTFTDKSAIGFSLLCAIHCLASPMIIVLMPSLIALPLNNEMFHVWMVVAVLPTSAYALTVGCRQHKHYRLLTLGLLGLTCLVLAVVLGEIFLSGVWEKMLTFIGAGIIAYGHYRNYRLCQHQENCACPGQRDELLK